MENHNPLSDERLAEIRERAERYAKWPSPATHEWALQVGTRDLPDLLAEVERLGDVIGGLTTVTGSVIEERDRLVEQVKRVREQHSARRIYGECGHRHEKPDADLGVKDVRAVGLVCEDGYDYTVCRACCCDPDGDQSRECAENHDRECWPCPTIRILDGSEAGR